MHDTYRGLTKVLWGFLLVLIDINIEYINLIPDFVGYAMVAYGLMQLGFEKERNWATGIAIFSFPSFIIPNRNLLAPGGEGYYLEDLYFTSLMILHFLLMYFVISRLIKAAESKGVLDIAQKARFRLTLYAAANIFILVASPFIVFYEEIFAFPIIAVAIFLFVMEVILLILISQFRKVL
jgi:hypothetical protein